MGAWVVAVTRAEGARMQSFARPDRVNSSFFKGVHSMFDDLRWRSGFSRFRPGKKQGSNDRPRATSADPLRRVRPERFAAKFIVLVGLLIALGDAVVQSADAPVRRLVCQVGLGMMLAHAVELVHQCLHKTATGRAAVDHAIGRLLALPALVSFWHYLYYHLWHHAHNGTEADRESFSYDYDRLHSRSRATRLCAFAVHVTQIRHYVTACRRMALATTHRLASELIREAPRMPAVIARKIERDYQTMLALLAICLMASLATRSTLLVNLWLIPLLLGYGPTHALIELPEHFGCAVPSSDLLLNTRSIRAGIFARWFTNNNCNHVGHHLDMMIPMDNLPEFERQLQVRQPFAYLEKSYPRFYARFIRSLWANQPMPQA